MAPQKSYGGYDPVPQRQVSDVSSRSISTVIASSPASPVSPRASHKRSASDGNKGLGFGRPVVDETDLSRIAEIPENEPRSRGEGYVSPETKPKTLPLSCPRLPEFRFSAQSLPLEPQRARASVQRVPVGSKSPIDQSPSQPLLSPALSSTSLGSPQYRHGRQHSSDYLKSQFTEAPFENERLDNLPRSNSPGQFYQASLETEPLRPYDEQCPSHRNFFQGKGDWLSRTILFLSIYSTVWSGLYLVVAIIEPRWTFVSSSGKVGPSTASNVATLFAKLTELSFVTVFVSFLGQVLSRRAFVRGSRGITIAEMFMRQWIMQPGTMITHWATVKLTALTFLGATALTACFIATFYTTASDALVSPVLKFGRPQTQIMYGPVQASYANANYTADLCSTPILRGLDLAAGTTCLQVKWSGESFRNLATYMKNWTEADGRVGEERPKAPAMFYDNTTVTGSWVNVKDIAETSTKYGRRVHNVTMAMPHAGVLKAAQDPTNNIKQPRDLAGVGVYEVIASVPSPAINVICMGLTEDEAMLFNASSSEDGQPPKEPVTDDCREIFDIPLDSGRILPTFLDLPRDYNTILNTSMPWADGAIFLIGKAGPDLIQRVPLTQPYELCSFRSMLTPNCSSRYHTSSSGGTLTSHCEDEEDELQYSRSDPSAPSGFIFNDWKDIASEWSNSLSLNAGISKGDAAVARFLTELITEPSSEGHTLSRSLPSSAEALAVLAGSTLLGSSEYAPFVHWWNYSSDKRYLDEPQYEAFNATIRSQDYASGGAQNWQKLFFIVLFLVFATNVFCLVFFFTQRGQVSDFTEPPNMFALAINSPPSHRLAGSCGGGPEKDQYDVSWFINVDENEHVYIVNGEEPAGWERKNKGRRRTRFEAEHSPIIDSYNQLRNQRHSVISSKLWS